MEEDKALIKNQILKSKQHYINKYKGLREEIKKSKPKIGKYNILYSVKKYFYIFLRKIFSLVS